MAQFRLNSMADLCRQMTFTPHDVLGGKLASAEELLHDIDAAKAYPLDYVVFRITGYRPKKVTGDLLTGLALEHDLGLLIEQLSDHLDLRVCALSEAVLAIDDVTRRFSVTSKTIQRWRRRGLPARRFTFPDGKRRVGFLLSSVEKFLARRNDQVAGQPDLSQIQEAELSRIVRNAQRLATRNCDMTEISQRIARKLGRSSMSIEHTLRKHDAENVRDTVLPRPAACLSAADRSLLIHRAGDGEKLSSLAARFKLPRNAVYRILLDEHVLQLKARKLRFIDDELYHQPDAAATIAAIATQHELEAASAVEDSRVPKDLPPYLRELYRTPLLSAARERVLFLKFNYHKFLFVTARRRLDPQLARRREIHLLERHLAAATAVKNQIVRANLRLVVSVARKHLRPGLNLMELISDGNISLMRAVESFDTHRGFRLSTYATLALMKGFARSVPLMQSEARVAGSRSRFAELADTEHANRLRQLLHRDEVGQLLSRLDDRARDIVASHFGLHAGAQPATYEELADRFGLTKSRVRQIETEALASLRAAGQG